MAEAGEVSVEAPGVREVTAPHLVIEGGIPLRGEIGIPGSKNSALPIITAAALAADGESILENVPNYTDIHNLEEILQALGAETEWLAPRTLRVRARDLEGEVAPYQLARTLRGSTYIVGLLLARRGRAEVAIPGGCEIGSRPVDFHLRGFAAMGAKSEIEHGAILAEARELHGARIFVDRASFGTTVNLMITAALAEGVTVLENAAREPEIVDLANFLSSLGVRVRGAGTGEIRIQGEKRLHGARHEIIPDRIVAGTYLLAGAASRGRVRVNSVIPEHLRTVIAKLEEAGVRVEETEDSLEVEAKGRLRSVDIDTQPHPGFPTDLQQPFLSAMTMADGVSIIKENIFDNRFGFTNELIRMGASVKVDRDSAIVRGVERLTGAPVEAADIRGGAALVVAGLMAEGTTEVGGLGFIDRGYERIEESLLRLGARIRREGA